MFRFGRRLRDALIPLLGMSQGTAGAIDLEGERARVLTFDPDAPPPLLDGESNGSGPHVVINTLPRARLSTVLTAIRNGGRTFHFVTAPGTSISSNARGALALVAAQTLRRGLARVPLLSSALENATGLRLDPPWPTQRDTLATVEAAVQRAGAAAQLPEGRLRITHCVGNLGPGGAERQLSYTARGTTDAGHAVRVLTLTPLAGEAGHYLPQLEACGARVTSIALHERWRPPPPLTLPGSLLDLLERHAASEELLPLIAALQTDRPDVLHCWLDQPNTVGAVAGLVAGVPRIVISTRNLNPARIPRLHRPWYRDSYRLLAESPRVTFVANSRAGADDYATWCGIDPARFEVVYNGLPLDALEPVAPGARAAERAAHGLTGDAFLVAGLFRLAPMKRPQDFVRVVAAASRVVPNLEAVHMGVGPLAEETRRLARELGVADRLRLLGRLDDPWSILRLADASLLPSIAEGCPNVSLESQALEVPIVLTRDAGSPETIEDTVSGFLCDVGDVEGMAGRLAELAEDEELRGRMGKRGRAWVEERFSLKRMLTRTLGLYRA